MPTSDLTHQRIFERLSQSSEDWLICAESCHFSDLTKQRFQEFSQYQTTDGTPTRILLGETEPVIFLASFVAAALAKCQIFLCNPQWGESEWQQVFDLAKPHLCLGNIPLQSFEKPILNFSLIDRLPHALILIPTGGSSGQIRFATHTWETLSASVKGFQNYFQRSPIHSVCTLPLYHVSGLMQFMRSFLTGGKLIISSFKTLQNGEIPQLDLSDFFISLVPTQLQRLLHNPKTVSWLSQFHTILLGGGPAWPELLETARTHSLRVAPTYGMTETASQIVTLKPDDFLAGYSGCGQVLPHASIEIDPKTGMIIIQSRSLMLGYWDENLDLQSPLKTFLPDDLGCFDQRGYLTILGRGSDKIITGGENVFPAEVEAAIRLTGLVEDVYVLGLPDSQWGQVVVAVYVPKDETVSPEHIKSQLQTQFSSYKIPKSWFSLKKMPRNSQGKINQQQLKQSIASQHLYQGFS